jgi:hypothetical protein
MMKCNVCKYKRKIDEPAFRIYEKTSVRNSIFQSVTNILFDLELYQKGQHVTIFVKFGVTTSFQRQSNPFAHDLALRTASRERKGCEINFSTKRHSAPLKTFRWVPGLPDLYWYNTPKRQKNTK